MPHPLLVPACCDHRGHFVRFYEDECLLMMEVAAFAQKAVAEGGTGIVIATADHLRSLQTVINDLEGVPVLPADRLLMLDAHSTLEQICVDGWPHPERFAAVVGELVSTASTRGGPVHAFGEMVAVLNARARLDAALRLENLWNDLAKKHAFSLFCAYPAAQFKSADHLEGLVQVCDTHTDVCAPEAMAEGASHAETVRFLATWRLKALALEAEVARRKVAEQALQQREAELADFIENAAEGLHRIAGDGTILWANRAELDMLGYEPQEYVGHHIAEFHADPSMATEILAKITSGLTLYDQPAQLRCKDGSVKNVLIHSNGFFVGGQLKYTRCFTRDVTDRLARQEAEAQRDSILMSAPVAAALFEGADLCIKAANGHFLDLFGNTSAVGQRFESAFPELAGSELASRLHAARRTGQPQVIEEWSLYRAGLVGPEEERWFKLCAQPLQGRRGAQDVIAIAHEITDQVKARRVLEKSFVEREDLLSELKRANQAKDEFLAMLGHELRNPLSPMVTALQLMRMRGDSSTQREQQIIQRQVDHLVRLVDDLLDVSKVTRGMIELKQESVMLTDVIGKAIEMASPLLEQRSHHFECDVPAGLRWRGDPVRLAQVVANLLTNAARYTPAGGHISVRARKHGSHTIEVAVRDDGIGLDRESLARIFDLFFQAGKSVDRAEGGLGIGLALVRSLVELHGGSVHATSDGPGCGSEFVIRLPADDSVDSGFETTCGPASACAQVKKKVLLVDDNVDGVELLGVLLRDSGHEVRVTFDPATALSAIEDFAPDYAVVDIGLPVMDGYELVDKLRERLGSGHCRYIALSGYGQAADRAKSIDAGFLMHLVKPVDPDALVAVIGRDLQDVHPRAVGQPSTAPA